MFTDTTKEVNIGIAHRHRHQCGKGWGGGRLAGNEQRGKNGGYL